MNRSCKIRVLHVIGGLGVGGAEKQLLGLLRRMDDSRFDQSVCYYSDRHDSLDGWFREAGIPTHFVDKAGQSLWRFFKSLREKIGEVSPDIVHTWLYSANFWGRWAAVGAGVPHILASDRIEVRDARLVYRLSERLLRKRTVRLANSMATARSMERFFGVPVETIRVIYNAVAIPACDQVAVRSEIRRELGVEQDQKLVLMVGRMHEQKNYPMFARVASRVCQTRGDVTFVAVGDGPVFNEIDGLVDQMGLRDQLRLAGRRDDVHRWLAAADVFCFTTNFEGFPNAMLEAMLSGLPVVCTRFAGVEEILNSPDLGVVVPCDDDHAMACQVERLLEDHDYRQALGEAARAYVARHYTWDTLVNRMSLLYEEVMGKSIQGSGPGSS